MKIFNLEESDDEFDKQKSIEDILEEGKEIDISIDKLENCIKKLSLAPKKEDVRRNKNLNLLKRIK